MEAILRALISKHKFSNWHKTKWLFICFSFMANKQIKNSCVDFFLMFCNFPVSMPNPVHAIVINKVLHQTHTVCA